MRQPHDRVPVSQYPDVYKRQEDIASGFAEYSKPCTYGHIRIDGNYYNGSGLTPALTNLGNTCISWIG